MLFEKYIICEEGFGNLYDEKGECTGFQLKVRLPYYLATMMVPNQVLLVPKYLLFQTLHMSNTHSALILPAMFEVFSVFLMRQAFMSVPRSLSESAIIDGASQFRVFGQIILPQIKPTLLTVTLLQFTSSWNDYINPKTYLHVHHPRRASEVPDEQRFQLFHHHGGRGGTLQLLCNCYAIKCHKTR